jgi:hypothetical protein
MISRINWSSSMEAAESIKLPQLNTASGTKEVRRNSELMQIQQEGILTLPKFEKGRQNSSDVRSNEKSK